MLNGCFVRVANGDHNDSDYDDTDKKDGYYNIDDNVNHDKKI